MVCYADGEDGKGREVTTIVPSLMATPSGRYYSDPGIFEQERDRIFHRSWFAVTHVSDVPTPGKFRTAQVGRENVVVVRGHDGAVQAFLNVCRHRGFLLCKEEYGEVRRNFRCAYHSWTYGLDGRLVAAPHLAKMPDVDRDDWGLKRLHVREYLGYVWVCLAEEPPSFEETVVHAITRRFDDEQAVDSWQTAELKVGRRISYTVKANWKIIVENFMECYHCASIHPELTSVIPECVQGYAAQHYVGRGLRLGDDAEAFSVDGTGGFDKLPGITEDQDRTYWGVTINPQVFINFVPDHVIFHRLFPISAESTVVECDWLFAKDVPVGAQLDHSVELFHRVNQQDFEVCEMCQLNMKSSVYETGGVLVPHEHHIAADFHSWYLRALETP